MKCIINDQVVYDSDTRTLSISDGSEVSLPVVTARLLEFFFAHHHQQLSRETLIEEVWGKQGLVPSGHSLSKNVSILRKALSGLGLDKIIETIPREGFVCTAELKNVLENTLSPNAGELIPARPRPRTKPSRFKHIILWLIFLVTSLITTVIVLTALYKSSDSVVYVKSSDGCEIYTRNDNSIDKVDKFLHSDMWQRYNDVCSRGNRTIVFYDDNSLSETNKLREYFFSICVFDKEGVVHECENYIY